VGQGRPEKTSKELKRTMHDRIDAVAGSAPGRLLPVEPTHHGRRSAPEEERALAPEPGASFAPGGDAAANTYAVPAELTPVSHLITPPDPVAPALAEALAAEPWGHPLPEKSMWERAMAARERTAEPQPQAPVTVDAAIPGPAAEPVDTPLTPVATTAAAPATHAAAVAAGSAAPVSPAWLTSLLKAR
jgi:hypothetical protein